ncbi:MAG: hypothetical protein CL609_10090 [Anaerolineaceae bacterium]|nr:hypothetical protein [Anaerolineaceae bacterium]
MTETICQLCNQNHQVYSVESIYFAIIDQDEAVLNEVGITKSKKRLNEFSPPPPPKKTFWARFSPDSLMLLVVVVFLLIPLLLNQNLNLNQTIGLILVFLMYLLFRNKLLSWYQGQQKLNQEHQIFYQQDIKKWQRNLYCPVKDEVFTATKD